MDSDVGTTRVTRLLEVCSCASGSLKMKQVTRMSVLHKSWWQSSKHVFFKDHTENGKVGKGSKSLFEVLVAHTRGSKSAHRNEPIGTPMCVVTSKQGRECASLGMSHNGNLVKVGAVGQVGLFHLIHQRLVNPRTKDFVPVSLMSLSPHKPNVHQMGIQIGPYIDWNTNISPTKSDVNGVAQDRYSDFGVIRCMEERPRGELSPFVPAICGFDLEHQPRETDGGDKIFRRRDVISPILFCSDWDSHETQKAQHQ
mmetsp:Transcript_5823/g.12966  ORF Transcript_5823/g.12966 Transcript_5823/m.12966 type:complete len:254 (-) Transcript_5823:36-797(-)